MLLLEGSRERWSRSQPRWVPEAKEEWDTGLAVFL